MPKLYLSPSSQEFNPYIDGGNEEYYMNLIADAMEPYLVSSGIQYTRNSTDMTAGGSITASNQGNYDFHLAIHSNAAPPGLEGTLTGSEVYYYPTSAEGRRAAEIFAENLRRIYRFPEQVSVKTSTSIGELRRTRAPAVLIELAYHDNAGDADWIRNNISRIAQNLVQSLTEYFEIPFIAPVPIRTGTVTTAGSNLNIREKPSTSASVIGRIPNGSEITVYSAYEDWLVIGYRGIIGYVYGAYVEMN